MTHNLRMKVDCLVYLSGITKKLKLYTQSLRLIKKALQYIWEIKDIDQEIHIYEEIGLIYFHMCNVEKAN